MSFNYGASYIINLLFQVTIFLGIIVLTKASFTGTSISSTAAPFPSTPVVTKTVIRPIEKTIILPKAFSTVSPNPYETDEIKFKTVKGIHHEKFSKPVNNVYTSNKFDPHAINGGVLLDQEITAFYANHANPLYYNYVFNHDNPLVQTVSPYINSVPIPVSYPLPVSNTLITPIEAYNSHLTSNYGKGYAPLTHFPSLSNIKSLSNSYGLPIERSVNIYNEVPLKPLVRSNIVAPITPPITTNYLPSLSYGRALEECVNHISHSPVVVSKSATTYPESPVVSHLSVSGLGTNYGW